MWCLFQMPGREKSRRKQAAQPRKQTLSIICLSTSHTFPPPPSPLVPLAEVSHNLPCSCQGERQETRGVLTNAVTQGGPMEARLAAHNTTVGAQAVLAPPCATDGIPIFFTLIHVCREESKAMRMVRWGPCCSMQHLDLLQLARVLEPVLVLLTSHQQL